MLHFTGSDTYTSRVICHSTYIKVRQSDLVLVYLINSSHQCRHKVGLAVIVGAAEDESLPPLRVDRTGARFPHLILALLSLEELFQSMAASIRRADITEKKQCVDYLVLPVPSLIMSVIISLLF